jgi:hypothetical protein
LGDYLSSVFGWYLLLFEITLVLRITTIITTTTIADSQMHAGQTNTVRRASTDCTTVLDSNLHISWPFTTRVRIPMFHLVPIFLYGQIPIPGGSAFVLDRCMEKRLLSDFPRGRRRPVSSSPAASDASQMGQPNL